MKKLLLGLFFSYAALAATYTVTYDSTTGVIQLPASIEGFTFNGDVFTDLTGNGVKVNAGALEVDGVLATLFANPSLYQATNAYLTFVATNGAGPVVRTVYTTPGSFTHTYTYAQGTHRQVHVRMVTPGGGGGSGRKGAAGSDRFGGGGGGGGNIHDIWFDRDELGAVSDTVVLGSPGAGGTAVTADSTNGNAGGNATATTFAGYGDGLGARGGTAGTTTAGTGGYGHNAGAASSVSATPTAPQAGGWGIYGILVAGGGGGGGVASTDTPRAGGSGAAYYRVSPTISGAAGGAATGVNGGDGTSGAVNVVTGGSSGGGGGGSSVAGVKGGDGGDGGDYGAGGGGGGAGTNTGDATGGSGAGGDGGSGIIIVEEFP